MSIILFGFKSCGKSYFGKKLASKLSCPFRDTDRIIEEQFLVSNGTSLSCNDIYKKLGENDFRLLETQALKSLDGVSNSVIAVGGGLVLCGSNVEILKGFGQLVYLSADKGILKNRMVNARLPAYLDLDDPEGSFERMYCERKILYESIRAIHVDLSGRSDDDVIRDIICRCYG